MAKSKQQESKFSVTKSGLWYRNKEGVYSQLTNFSAKIKREIIMDDGANRERIFELEIKLNGVVQLVTVPAVKFGGLQWVAEQVGSQAIVYTGAHMRDYVKAAIQEFSKPRQDTLYAHMGWREVNGEWVFLHAGGVIGRAESAPKNMKTSCPEIGSYSLPKAPNATAVRKAFAAALRVLEIGSRRIGYGLLAAAFRAPLAEALPIDFSLFCAGSSGKFKSAGAAIGQAFYGSQFDGTHLPENWSSTGNALERKAFLAKDVLFTIDDFAPIGTQKDVQALHGKADRLLRAQGNGSGRGRMTQTQSLQSTNFPRGLILSTGEDVPKGQSLRARCVIVEFHEGDVKREILTELQASAANGEFAKVMAAYLQWLAPQIPKLKDELQKRRDELREIARESVISHARTPQNIAGLALGLDKFLEFGVAIGALDGTESNRLWTEGWEALQQLGAGQKEHDTDADPAQLFIRLLKAAVVSGRCYFANRDGQFPDEPAQPNAWGWFKGGDGLNDWRPGGRLVGWLDGPNVYLDPIAAYIVAQEIGHGSNQNLTISQQTLGKRLKESGTLAAIDQSRQTNTIRKTLQGMQREVWAIAMTTIAGETKGEMSEMSDLSEKNVYIPPQNGATNGVGDVTV